MISDLNGLLTIFILVPCLIFTIANKPSLKKFFEYFSPLLAMYLVTMLLSTFGVIPKESPHYKPIQFFLIFPGIVLLCMTVDVKAVLKLGVKPIVIFFAGALGVMLGAWMSYGLLLALKTTVLAERFPEFFNVPADIWKAMAAMSAAWIGGVSNLVAAQNALGVSSSDIGLMLMMDAVAGTVWNFYLFGLAANHEKIDARWGSDMKLLHSFRDANEKFQTEQRRPTTLVDLLKILSVALGGGWLAFKIGEFLAVKINDVSAEMAGLLPATILAVIAATTIGIILSFTRLRKLDGAGASQISSLAIVIILGILAAGADIGRFRESPVLALVGMVWLIIHGIVIYIATRLLKQPVFFMAVGSQANIGGTASAPVLAAAFHPALTSLGIPLALLGTLSGTYLALFVGKVFVWLFP